MALRPRLGRVFQCLVVGNLNYFIQIYISIYFMSKLEVIFCEDHRMDHMPIMISGPLKRHNLDSVQTIEAIYIDE